MDTSNTILYQVAFKGVIELVSAGTVEPETDDIVAEVIDLTDAFYEALAVKTGAGEEAAPKEKRARTSSRKPSTRSSGRDSGRGGNTDDKPKGPKDPNADASVPQINAIKKKLDKAGIEYDRNGFDYDGEEIFWDELTMGSVQRFFDEL